MNKKITFIVFLLFSMLILHANEEIHSKYVSAYTSIDQKDCMTLDSDNLGSIQECESFADIKVKVVEGDIRQSITLTREDREYDLEFSSIVNSALSSLGSKIEWRYEKDNLNALKGMIVRLDVNDDPENLEHTTSYLIVNKITRDNICIVGKILPQEKQHDVARAMLDSSDELPCLKKKEQ